MSKLNTEKLSVDFREGVTTINPIIPRRYTLTHSDITGEFFLTIGSKYDYNKIKSTRDELLGEWVKIDEDYFFNVYLYVDGEFGPASTAERNTIFRRELPLALDAIRYGDKDFFNDHSELDNGSIIIYFISTIPYFNRVENWGTFEYYDITKPYKMRISDSFFTDNYLMDMKIGDVNGDDLEDKVSLYGNKENTTSEVYTNNIIVMIRDGKTNSLYTIPLKVNSGYNASLFLGDFTGDKIDDILVSIYSGGSDGYGLFYVYSFINNDYEKLFDFEIFNDQYIYDVIYKDNYKVLLINKTLNKKFIIDISNKDASYLASLYDENGKLKDPIYGSVSAITELYPVDTEKKGVYNLWAIQRIIGIYNGDTLGFIQTPLSFNGESFQAINLNQFTAIVGSSKKCLPDYYDKINLTYRECMSSEKERDINLENALTKTFNLQPEMDKTMYYYNRVDLNDDGIPETFVYVVGNSVCGTGGCGAAIFKQSNNGYELISKFSLVNNPIIISDTKTNGFNDIIMYISGGGAENFFAELKYDGTSYPSNPSIQPHLNPETKVNGIVVVADDLTENPGIQF